MTFPPPEHNFSVKVDEWELLVFNNAIMFTAVMSLGGGPRIRHEYKTFPEAVADAETWKGPYGRQATVHAVTAVGRHVTLTRKDWPKLMELWRARCVLDPDSTGSPGSSATSKRSEKDRVPLPGAKSAKPRGGKPRGSSGG